METHRKLRLRSYVVAHTRALDVLRCLPEIAKITPILLSKSWFRLRGMAMSFTGSCRVYCTRCQYTGMLTASSVSLGKLLFSKAWEKRLCFNRTKARSRKDVDKPKNANQLNDD